MGHLNHNPSISCCSWRGCMFISRVLYLLVGTALSVTSLPTANYATACSTEAWWIVHGLPKATVLSMLPPNCTLAPHGLSLPPNQHHCTRGSDSRFPRCTLE